MAAGTIGLAGWGLAATALLPSPDRFVKDYFAQFNKKL